MKLFKYEGPVLDYNNKVRKQSWVAYTNAINEDKALNNLKAQYLKENGLTFKAAVKLKKDYLERG